MIRKVLKFIELIFYLVALFMRNSIYTLFSRSDNNKFEPKGKNIVFFDVRIPSNSSAGEKSFIELYHYLGKHAKLLFLVGGNTSTPLKGKSGQIENIKKISLIKPIKSRKILLEADYVVIMSPEARLFFNILSLLLFVNNTKVIYYSTDIFSLRYGREYNITKSLSSLFYSYYYKLCEPLIWTSAASCLSNREDESQVIQNYNKNVSVVPTRVFYNLTKVDYKTFNAKNKEKIDFLFVGGIGNAPNISAVDFIIDQLIDELNSGLSREWRIHIVGSGWKEYLADKKTPYNNIIVYGVVSDSRLDELYEQCFFSLATLQFGSGVKGKVIEAMLHSLVVITTPIGSEGIDCKTLKSCLTAECMVNECNKFLMDKDFWQLTVDGYYDYLNENLGETAMSNGLNI
jgi:hypothetical protein